jgi:hypothetical protein
MTAKACVLDSDNRHRESLYEEGSDEKDNLSVFGPAAGTAALRLLPAA